MAVVALSITVLSESSAKSSRVNPIDSRLVGTWHSTEIRCADLDRKSVLSAQLTISKTGEFSWVHFADLNEPDICSGHLEFAAPNTLKANDCDFDPYSDHLEYELKESSLILSGNEWDVGGSTPPEKFTIRLIRGPLQIRWIEPPECVCNEASVPQWTESATQIILPSDHRWASSEEKKRISDTNELLWRAVQAFHGKRGPITLKHFGYSIEGDRLEEYLKASRGRAEYIFHSNEGMMEHLETCTCPLAEIKLKVKAPIKHALWQFAFRAPLPSAEAYITYPGEHERMNTFPRY